MKKLVDNYAEIRRTLSILIQPDQVFEVRGFDGKTTYSGYFKDIDKCITCLEKAPDITWYVVMNPIKGTCYNRKQRDKILSSVATTKDVDITRRSWLMVDADPNRPKGMSATDSEKVKAKLKIDDVKIWLDEMGFPSPIVADSGNGFHLMYALDLENSGGNKKLIHSVLKVLDKKFTDEHTKLDPVVYNASRITKLHGTVARKGEDTQDRPHRQSKTLEEPEEMKVVDMELLEKVAAFLSTDKEKSPNPGAGGLKGTAVTQDNYNSSSEMSQTGKSDAEYLAIGLERDDLLKKYWSGEYRPSDDESGHDQGFMNKLAYWCNHNRDLMLESFLKSPYYASKPPGKNLDKCENRTEYYLMEKTIPEAIRNTPVTARAKDEAYRHEQAVKDFADPTKPTLNDWIDPVPFEADTQTPTFPIHCLPDTLRNYVSAVAEHTQTSVDMSAIAALGAVSTCLQGKFLVEGKPGWREPVNNYYIVVAKPGERKSAVCSIFEEPIKEYEKRYNEDNALEIAQSANIRQVLEKELDTLKGNVAKGKATYEELEQKQKDIFNHKDKKPLRLTCGDVTPEALTSLLAENNGRMSMFSAEGGVFDMLNGMYSQVTNMDIWLKAHCGDSVLIDRKGRPPENIKDPCITTLLFVQPKVLGGLVGNDTFRGRGLVARFLYTYPQSTVGERKYKTEPIPTEVEQKYKKMVVDMLDTKTATPQVLTLSEKAVTLSEQFFNDLEPRLGRGGDLEHMADWAGKLHGAVLRIAGLHYISNIDTEVLSPSIDFGDGISGDSMAAAIEIGNYFLAHAQVCYEGSDENTEKAKYLLGQLEKKKPVGELRPSDVWQVCKGKRFKKVSDILPSLDILASHGFVRVLSNSGTASNGRPKGERFKLNPLHFKINMAEVVK